MAKIQPTNFFSEQARNVFRAPKPFFPADPHNFLSAQLLEMVSASQVCLTYLGRQEMVFSLVCRICQLHE